MVSLVVISKVYSSTNPGLGVLAGRGIVTGLLKICGDRNPLKSVAWRSRDCSLPTNSMLRSRERRIMHIQNYFSQIHQSSNSLEGEEWEEVERPGMYHWCLALHSAGNCGVGSHRFHLTPESGSPVLGTETTLRFTATCPRHFRCFGVGEREWEGWEL